MCTARNCTQLTEPVHAPDHVSLVDWLITLVAKLKSTEQQQSALAQGKLSQRRLGVGCLDTETLTSINISFCAPVLLYLPYANMFQTHWNGTRRQTHTHTHMHSQHTHTLSLSLSLSHTHTHILIEIIFLKDNNDHISIFVLLYGFSMAVQVRKRQKAM